MPKVQNPRQTQENIEAVARLEQEFLEQRSLTERTGDLIAGFVGSMKFVALHAVWFFTWFLINTGHMSGVPRFDPYRSCFYL